MAWSREPSRGAGEPCASLVEPHQEVAAGERDNHLALAMRRRRDRNGARPGRACLTHSTFPQARRHAYRPIDASDLHVRPSGKTWVRLEQRPDQRQIARIAEDDRVRVTYIDRRHLESGD